MKKCILITVNVLFFAGLLALLVWPKFITNDYCEFKITKLTVSSHPINGDECSILYSCVSTSHTTVFVSVLKNGSPYGSGGGYSDGFPYWPDDALSGGLKSHQSDMIKTMAILQVKIGEVYTVTSAEPLLLYDYTNDAGDTFRALVEVYSGDQVAALSSFGASGTTFKKSTTSYGSGP